MSIKLRGRMVEKVEVEMTPTELLKGLQQYFNIDMLYDTDADTYWNWDESGNALIELKDTSRHGTPSYKETGRVISDGVQIKAYMLLENIKKLMEEKENEKRP